MISLKYTRFSAILALSLCSVTSASAALHNRVGGMIYDDVRNVTWLADMAYAKTSGYDADGLMDWATATAWAANLVYKGYTDWRLPTINPFDSTCEGTINPGGGFPLQRFGFNCTGGELTHLFVADLGNSQDSKSVYDHLGDSATQIANFTLFVNVPSYFIWSANVFEPSPTTNGWIFNSALGTQHFNMSLGSEISAIAVRDGNVAPVPELGTAVFLLAGLGMLISAIRVRT